MLEMPVKNFLTDLHFGDFEEDCDEPIVHY